MNILKIIKDFALTSEWDWFVLHNPSNDLPYHNKFHTECMINNCYEGAQYYNLSWDATRNLLWAAIYHDYGHTGGLEPDSENIRRALHHGLRFKDSVRIDKPVPKIVIDCVLCTEFPFVYEPYTIEQRIIRDADLMQFRFDNWKDMLFVKLKEEMEVQYGRKISDEEMKAGQYEFWVHKVKFHTKWGIEVLETYGKPFRSYLESKWL